MSDRHSTLSPLARVAGFDRLLPGERNTVSRGFATLRRQQQRFVIEYLVDLNATQAAIRAKYSKKTADVQGPALLGKLGAILTPLIKAQQAELVATTTFTRERWLQEIQRVAFYDPRKFFDTHNNAKDIPDLDDEAAAALAGFEITEEFSGKGAEREAVGFTKKFKLANKLQALELFGKATGYLVDALPQALTLIQANTVNLAPTEAYRRMIEGSCPQRS